MKNLPNTIIIRYDDKHDSEVRYKKTIDGYFNEIKQKYFIFSKSKSEQEIWAAIKRLCELWLENKIFFEYPNPKSKKYPYKYDAKDMLKEMSK
jgi:hypothetical protein